MDALRYYCLKTLLEKKLEKANEEILKYSEDENAFIERHLKDEIFSNYYTCIGIMMLGTGVEIRYDRYHYPISQLQKCHLVAQECLDKLQEFNRNINKDKLQKFNSRLIKNLI